MSAVFKYRVGGTETEFRTDPLDVKKLFHITRKLAPIVSAFVATAAPLVQEAQAKAKAENKKIGFSAVLDLDLSKVMGNLANLGDALAKLPDADAEYVLFGLLEAVSINRSGWHPIVLDGNLMYKDLTLPVLLYLAGEVAGKYLGDFFGDALSSFKAAALTQNSPQAG